MTSDTTTPPYQLLTREMIAEQGVNGLRAQLMRNNSDWPLHRDQCEWLLEQVAEMQRVVAEAVAVLGLENTDQSLFMFARQFTTNDSDRFDAAIRNLVALAGSEGGE